MIPMTNKPTEGEVFDVQDHTRRTGTSWTGTHGEMISSDLHGAEEPIRWLLGWQRQDRVMTSPCMEKKKDALIRTLWQRLTYGGSAPTGGMMALMDKTPPGQTGRFLEDVAVCLDLVARVAACTRPRGANVLLLGC